MSRPRSQVHGQKYQADLGELSGVVFELMIPSFPIQPTQLKHFELVAHIVSPVFAQGHDVVHFKPQMMRLVEAAAGA